MNPEEFQARNVIRERIRKGLLGPGSDTWGLPDSEEVISDYPLQRYYTGILFPKRVMTESQAEIDNAELRAETAEEDIDGLELPPEGEETLETDEQKISKKDDHRIANDEEKIFQNNFFPTNIGLTFCVEGNLKEIEVEFKFGLYYEPEITELKIGVPESVYHVLIGNENFPFKEKLKYEDGFLFLTKPLEGHKGGASHSRSGEYLLLDEFKKSDSFKKDDDLRTNFYFFEKLFRRAWKRKEINHSLSIPLINSEEIKYFYEEQISRDQNICAGYNLKTYNLDNRTYIKVTLVNDSTPQHSKKFSNKNQNLNRKSLFQSEIKIISENLKPYKSYQELNPFDEEAAILNFLYRKVMNYGVGHNTSITWDKESKSPKWINTTFIPEHDVKDIKNQLVQEDFDNENDFKILNECLDIYNLSHWGLGKAKVLENLVTFVHLYEKWIVKQKQINAQLTPNEQRFGKALITNLEDNLKRLKTNIQYLEDDVVFRCFQLANTAMLIQLIISNDEDFGKKEKLLSEIDPSIPYNSFDFFKNYNFTRLKFDRPQYRPFQLAFILLTIDGIINLESKERNEIVDLLWFPTGGGKTEAYLAAAAFTIIWRRINNPTGYGGTSIIMRYTLRLLTAQQFERASRLIAALEFMRKNLKDKLGEEPITIGLWVGMAATPNTIDEANDKLKNIERECERDEQGRPEDKNVFQISACPWCGSKLINKNPSNNMWVHGFEKGRADFRIKCLNNKCQFTNGIPVQVVDEMLYKEPPTLLFATVDKFAVLAWQEEGHRFFDSLDKDNLPPDLIIQDELHLLSGPLGSITGIFESVIELLCRRDGRCPKIIASTATTRNTNYQISQLYGNREVSVFPPSGLDHTDSFFARESKQKSKRRYMGIMPTGKTALDTQLQILAHLLVSRIEIYQNQELRDVLKHYWTIVSYYNSLKDVGKIANKVGDELFDYTRALQINLFGENPEFRFNYSGLTYRQEELTSRIESYRIKHVLKQLEERFFSPTKIKKNENGETSIYEVIDLILATNMISVGIDIGSLNLMVINSQPKNIAEYIQASSRVGRQNYGLVITLLDANRARDKSYFEHFIPFHQAFYKSVEPLSITPFTENTIDKMLTSIMITFIRHKIPGMAQNSSAHYFDKSMLNELIDFIKQRFGNYVEEYKIFEARINMLADEWIQWIKEHDYKKYSELMKKPVQKDTSEDDKWIVMQSMREIDTSTYIKIKQEYLSEKL